MAGRIGSNELTESYQLKGWRKPAAVTSTMGDCALIVPTYKRIAELQRLFQTLVDLEEVPGEFIVVDGSPEDELDLALREWVTSADVSFDVIYIRSPAGLTRQRNVGVDACSKPFIFFLDDDCVPERSYFQKIREVFESDRDREIGAVRGFMTNPVELKVNLLWKLRYRLSIVPNEGPGLYHHCGTSCTWNGIPPFKGTKEIDVLAGGAAAYRREVFDSNRFSQFFYGYSQGEDLEMSLRIRKDWKIVLSGEAHVDHREATHGRPPGFKRGRMVARNRFFIWKRHSPCPGLKNSIRFWADQLLVVSYNIAVFVVRPTRPYYLAYVCGISSGLLECIISPPAHEEPAARREYSFCLTELDSGLYAAVA